MEEELKHAAEAKQHQTKASSFNAVVQLPQGSTGVLTRNPELDHGITERPLFPYKTESPFGVLIRPEKLDFTVGFPGSTNISPQLSIFSRRVFKALPPRDEAQLLIKRSFQGFLSGYPIFAQTTCLKLLEYYDQGLEDPAWWACVNVVLAMAYRFRAMKTLNHEKEDREAWGYLKNALAVVTELTMMHPKLTSVQALLGIAMIVQGTPNSRPYSALLSSAMKLAQNMGLHRRNEDPNIDVDELEERKQVFWIGYFLDKDLSLQNGQPPTQEDDEMDVGLPIRTIKQPGHSSRVNFFEHRMRLALIQGQIYKRLCSVKAQRQSLTDRMYAVAELEAMLHAWRDSVPIDFTNEKYFSLTPTPFFRPVLQEVIARFTYFKSLNTIHRCSVFGVESERSSEAPHKLESGHVLPDLVTSVTEARKAIQLLHVTPLGDYACIWVSLHVFVSATTTLLNYLIADPRDPLAHSDLKLIEPLLVLLGELSKTNDENHNTAGPMYRSCTELFERARTAVEFADMEEIFVDPTSLGSINDGGRREKESVEDFIKRIDSYAAGEEQVEF